MKNLYNSFKFLKLAAIPMVLLLIFSFSSYSQTRLDTVIVGFNAINNEADGVDNEPFYLTDDCGVVTNFKAEIIYDETNGGTVIDRLRTPALELIPVNNTTFTLPNVENYTGSIAWQIWLTEQDLGVTDSVAVRITYEFDTIASPVAICKDAIITLDETGSATLNPQDIDGGSDGCLSINNSSFDCADLGINTITLTATATDGSTATCDANVEVTNISCKDTTLYLEANGEATLDSLDLLNEVTYSCGTIDSIWLSKDTFDINDLGVNMVTLFAKTATDTSWCYSTVTVMDTLSAKNCKDTVVYVDADGMADITAADLYTGEGVDVDSMWLSQDEFSCDDAPSANVTLYVRDAAMDTTQCLAVVTVEDTISPTALCQDTTVKLDVDGNFTLTPAHIDDGSSDNCSFNMSVSESSFTAGGNYNVTLTVEDASGNQSTCVSVVTVQSAVTCKDTTLYLDESGAATLSASDVVVENAVDPVDKIWLAKTDFGCSDPETFLDSLYVVSGIDTTVCISNVTLMDTLAPVATCQDTTVYLDEDGLVSINSDHILVSANDNCANNTDTLLSQTAFNCNGTGENLVTVTLTDDWGNTSSCTATVNVMDTLLPSAACKNITVQLDDNDLYSLEASDIDDGSADNCGIALMSVDMPELNCSNVGDNTVTLTVTDNSGNISTCESTVTVEDVTAPSLVCEETTIYLRDNGVYVLDREEIRGIAVGADNTNSCASSDFLTVEISQRLFQCEDAGMSVPVTITATDGLGQVSTCETVVNVRDTVSPVVSCVDETVELYLDESGSAELSADMIMTNDEADSCEPYDMELSQSTFGCADAGENTVTLTVTDPSNNTGSCSAMVMVYDTLAPVVDTIENIEMELEPGVCESTIEYPTPEVMDNCDVELELVEGLGAEGVFPAGTTTETWTATDAGGNSVTFSFDVTLIAVNDTPTINQVDDVIAFAGTSPVNVELSGISSGNDCVEQDVMISAVASNTDLVTDIMVNYTQGNATGSLDLTIAPEMTGESDIIVMVEDPDGAMIADTFMVTINAAENNPPMVVTPVPDQVVNASYVLKVPISNVLGEYFDDPDGDELTLDVMLENGDPLPAWATIVDDTIVAEPMIEDTGCVMIVVEAMDPDGASAADTFELCVDGYPVGIDQIAAGQFEINLYPNPTRGMVNIDFKSNDITEVDLSVTDITGRQILRKKYSAAERISFNLNENVSGMYFVKLDFDGKHQIVKKIILDRK